ncbi:MAG: hypothetical protein ABII79_12240 [bacterium]
MRSLVMVIPTLLLMVSVADGLEPATEVFSSEDELYQAWQLGEIDYQQYLTLREIIVHGLDSAAGDLFDEIPNLSAFLRSELALRTSLEKEQRAVFSCDTLPTTRPHTVLRYRYVQEISESGRGEYRTSGRFYLGGNLHAALMIHRGFSGTERIVSRGLTYRNRQTVLRELTLGSFSRRLGAGTVLGYRGKLLESSDRLEIESVLFPDYGGFNGFYAKTRWRGTSMQTLASVNRDNDHSIVSYGGMISAASGSFRPGVILGATRLKNRTTGVVLDDVKYALSSDYRYRSGYLRLESCGQTGARPAWAGLVVEGRHRLQAAEVRYAGWVYADTYLDLAAGGKSGRVLHTTSLDRVDFTYSTRRSGQAGAMIRSIVRAADDLEVVNSVLYAGLNSDSLNVRYLAALVWQTSPGRELRFDFLNRTRKRGQVQTDRRLRMESRINAGNLTARSYIAYNTGSDKADHLSVFVNVRYRSRRLGSFEAWSNLARFDLKEASINYWYWYLSGEQQLFQGVTAVTKLSHSYQRSSSAPRTLIRFQLKVTV